MTLAVLGVSSVRLLSNNPKGALKFYKDYLALDSNNAGTMYSIARLYAQMKDGEQAWKWLELAMNRGFRYHWVLHFDDTWDSYRKQDRWVALHRRYPAKEYGSTPEIAN